MKPGTSSCKTQQTAGRRYKRDADPLHGVTTALERKAATIIARREHRRPICHKISVRMSGGTWIARIVGMNVTASCTESRFAAASAVARKFASRMGLRFVAVSTIAQTDGEFEVELARTR